MTRRGSRRRNGQPSGRWPAANRKKRRVEEARKEPRLGGGPMPAVVAPTLFPAPRPTLSGGAPGPRPPGPIVY